MKRKPVVIELLEAEIPLARAVIKREKRTGKFQLPVSQGTATRPQWVEWLKPGQEPLRWH